MPAVPRSMSGRRPHRSTEATAMRVKMTQEPLMITCCRRPASTPVEALRFLKMVAPKYMKTLIPVTCCRTARAMPEERAAA
jgi:hypothetical protein